MRSLRENLKSRPCRIGQTIARRKLGRNIEGLWETKLTVSRDVSHQCFVKPPNAKVKKNTAKNRLLVAGWHTNLLPFQRARPDHVRVELVSFDQRHVTRCHAIGKRISV